MPLPKLISSTRWVVLPLLMLLPACSHKPSEPSAQRTISAHARTIHVEEVAECRSFPAQVESRNSVTLASKLSGAIVEIMAQEGATLKAGDPIMRIDDKDLQSRDQGFVATMAQVASERQALEAQAAHAKANLERLSRLLTQKVISQDDFEKARTEYLALARGVDANTARENAVAAQKAELKSLSAYTRINAPFDGVLTRRYVDRGAFVNAGQPLAMLDDVSSGFDLVAQVDESLLPDLAPGRQVAAALPELKPEPFAAKVSAVVGRVDPATRTFKLKTELPHGDSVQPKTGMYGRVFLPVRVSKKLLLPVECLRMRGDLPTVFVVDTSGVVSFRVIKPGGHFTQVMLEGKPFLTDSETFEFSDSPAYVEVLSGLAAGERVVCSKTETLRQGDRLDEAAR